MKNEQKYIIRSSRLYLSENNENKVFLRKIPKLSVFHAFDMNPLFSNKQLEKDKLAIQNGIQQTFSI